MEMGIAVAFVIGAAFGACLAFVIATVLLASPRESAAHHASEDGLYSVEI